MGKTIRYKHQAIHESIAQEQSSTSPSAREDYSKIKRLNGKHPWKKHVPEGLIEYQARKLNKGDIAYFNFNLAKEMGLISKSHPYEMNEELQRVLIDTFAIQIVNEYDIEKNIEFNAKDMKKGTFMATRYLQLQHPNKQGKTSGDGRGIWNGTVKHKGITWDVSSRGTGVTALAPGVVLAGKPLRSGNTDFGYGCGLAEIDELYASALMAEILHNFGFNTERMLAIIDTGKGFGIGVRAGQNLIRPAHLFMYLKQDNLDALIRATDYLIERQTRNGEWRIPKKGSKKYDGLLKEMCRSFAEFAAQLEREYIFAWLDWDGDNVLANAGIIDYGSVRMFGLRHDNYRYDDVQRFSTNLNEQKAKARLTVQVVAQMVDYIKTGKKKTLSEFKHHKSLKSFDRIYQRCLQERLLHQVGFTQNQANKLLHKYRREVKEFYSIYISFERAKVTQKPKRVADGINKPAIYNMRRLLRDLPLYFAKASSLKSKDFMPPKEFLSIIASEFATRRQTRVTSKRKRKIKSFQEAYTKLFRVLRQNTKGQKELMRRVSLRTKIINREDRVTGNALLHITNEIMKYRKKGLSHREIQLAMDNFIAGQTFVPEQAVAPENVKEAKIPTSSKKLVDNMFKLVDGYNEDI